MILPFFLFFAGIMLAWFTLKALNWLPCIAALAFSCYVATAGNITICNSGSTFAYGSWTCCGGAAGANSASIPTTTCVTKGTDGADFSWSFYVSCDGSSWHLIGSTTMGDNSDHTFTVSDCTGDMPPTSFSACQTNCNPYTVPVLYTGTWLGTNGVSQALGAQMLQPGQCWILCATNSGQGQLMVTWVPPGSVPNDGNGGINQTTGTGGTGPTGVGPGGGPSGSTGNNNGQGPGQLDTPPDFSGPPGTNNPQLPFPPSNPYQGSTNPASIQGEQAIVNAVNNQSALLQTNAQTAFQFLKNGDQLLSQISSNQNNGIGSNLIPYLENISSNVVNGNSWQSNFWTYATNQNGLAGQIYGAWLSQTGATFQMSIGVSNAFATNTSWIAPLWQTWTNTFESADDDFWNIAPHTNVLGTGGGPMNISPRKVPMFQELAAICKTWTMVIIAMWCTKIIYGWLREAMRKLLDTPSSNAGPTSIAGYLLSAGATVIVGTLLAALPIYVGALSSWLSPQAPSNPFYFAASQTHTGPAMQQGFNIFNMFVPWNFLTGTAIYMFIFFLAADAYLNSLRIAMRQLLTIAIMITLAHTATASPPSTPVTDPNFTAWLTVQSLNADEWEVLSDDNVIYIPGVGGAADIHNTFRIGGYQGSAVILQDTITGTAVSITLTAHSETFAIIDSVGTVTINGVIGREGLWEQHAPDSWGSYFQYLVEGYALGMMGFGTIGISRRLARILYNGGSPENM